MGAGDTFYYDCLEVPPSAAAADIRRAYYRLAMRYHPDRNLAAPPEERAAMEAKFKQVNDAYQVLSDAKRRSTYDQLGREAAQQDGVFMDPREVFKMVFGGEAFVDIIGELSFVQIMADAGQGEPGQRSLTEAQLEEMKRQRTVRVARLSCKLIDKLALLTGRHYTRDEFGEYCRREAANLKGESFGPELLRSVGYVYSMRAKQFLGRSSFLGLSSLYHSVKEKGHIVSQVVSTVSAATEVMRDNRRGQAAIQQPRQPPRPPSPPAQVDEAKLRNLMWQMASLEVESVLREVCDRVLAGADAAGRAQALKILGDAYRKT